eukprot:scaffold624_cov402-Prasinococcus_capsulatus_cf.AAC.19
MSAPKDHAPWAGETVIRRHGRKTAAEADPNSDNHQSPPLLSSRRQEEDYASSDARSGSTRGPVGGRARIAPPSRDSHHQGWLFSFYDML